VESWEPYVSYALALFSGLLIGLEREHSRSELTDPGEKSGGFVAGVRTTPLFSLSACVAGSLAPTMGPWPFLILLAGALGLAVVSYARGLALGHTGLTSIGAFIVAVMLGGLSGSTAIFASVSHKAVAVAALSVVATLLLSVKPILHEFSSRISRDDVIATLKFLMVAVVVLPLLPDAPHGPWGVLNPFKIGLMVALLAGVSFVGYAASRILGRGRGLLWTGAIGGLVSSTAVTLSAARQTKATPDLADFSAISVMVASSVMAVRVLIVASVTFPAMTGRLVMPMAGMALGGVGYAAYLWWRSKTARPKGQEAPLTNPFELSATLQMAALLVGVLLFSKWATHEFGQGAAYVTALFAGLADVDAITLSMARLAQTQELALTTAVASIFIAVASNTIVKGSMSAVLGNRALASRVGFGFALMMAAGGTGLAVAALLSQ
jgi:uncharacterized membrane protein (DUF4010 family)